jgi:hypothetical protein
MLSPPMLPGRMERGSVAVYSSTFVSYILTHISMEINDDDS